jgi:6-phosphogluconolactonase (cycloisomerase 2 family)
MGESTLGRISLLALGLLLAACNDSSSSSSPYTAQASFQGLGASQSTQSMPAVDATGSFLYVADGEKNILGFSINPTTGALALLSGSPFAAAASPYMATAHGAFLYVSNNSAVESISTFAINPSGGGLTQLSSSPVPIPDAPYGGAYNIAIAP